MRKKRTDDYRDVGEKTTDFVLKHRKKIVWISFFVSLIMVIISVFTHNEAGVSIIIFYPIALICFLVDPSLAKHMWKGRPLMAAIMIIFFLILGFVLGFFIELNP